MDFLPRNVSIQRLSETTTRGFEVAAEVFVYEGTGAA